MTDWNAFFKDLHLERASLDRRSITVLCHLLGLPEGFSYSEAEDFIEELRMFAGEGACHMSTVGSPLLKKFIGW